MALSPSVVVAHYTLREVPCQIKSGYLPKSSNHVIDDWRKQINSTCNLLLELSAHSPMHCSFVLEIINWLRDDAKAPQKLDQPCADFLDFIHVALQKGDIPGYLASRVITRLPRVVSKKKSGYLSDMSIDTNPMKQLENKTDKEVDFLREDIRLAKVEREKCIEQIIETKNRNPFSQIVMQVAEHENFSVEREDISLPERLSDWLVYHFREHVAFSIKTPREQTYLGTEPLDQVTAQDQIRRTILFLAADPTDASRLRLGEEFKEIQEKLKLAKLRDRFVLELPQLSIQPTDVSQALLDTQPQIVHFSGHGTSTGALCFENQIGQTHLVQPDALAALFEQFTQQVDCVLLNACYSENQARAIAEHIRCVIGMNRAIGDKAAIAFSIGFYQALGAGRTIEELTDLDVCK